MRSYRDLLIEGDSYKLNYDVFYELSNYAKEQLLKEYKEFVLENCEDFQMFDEWLDRPRNEYHLDEFTEGCEGWLQSIAEQYNLDYEKAISEDCYWIGDAFKSEEDFQEYVDDEKENFVDSLLECEYFPITFQSSDYYNMYLFIEPTQEKYKHGAYSPLFDTTSHYWKDTDDILFESEEEEMLYKIADEKIYSRYPEDVYPEFIKLGLEILAKYPNADMLSVAEWVDEHLNSGSCHLNCKLIGNYLVAAVDDNIVQMELVA